MGEYAYIHEYDKSTKNRRQNRIAGNNFIHGSRNRNSRSDTIGPLSEMKTQIPNDTSPALVVSSCILNA